MKLIINTFLTLLYCTTFAAQPDSSVDQPTSNEAVMVTFDSHEDLLYAFHAAAAKSSQKILDAFLAAGIGINEPDRSGKTALHHAAAEARMDTILWLIEQGADLEATDANGCSPLLSAAQAGVFTNVGDLLDAGADISIRDKFGRSALDLAISSANPLTVKALIKAGSSLEATPQTKGFTPLHRAAKKGVVEIAQMLLSAGAHINAVEKESGWTPLHYAANHSANLEMIALLTEANANATLKDQWGRTPRDLANLWTWDYEECTVCPLRLIKLKKWEEAILRLRLAELPSSSRDDLEQHLGLKKKKDEL